MSVRWDNIFVAAVALFALTLLVRQGDLIAGLLSLLGQMGPGLSPEDRFAAFLSLGLILVSVVVIVRILVKSRRDDP